MKIRMLTEKETAPMELLLLADPNKKLVKEYIMRGECYILEEDENPIGVFVLLPTRPDTIELVNVAVAKPYQGRGLGKSLIIHAVQVSREKGYKTIEVGTGNSSINQLVLYQKCGFRMTGVDVNYFKRHYKEAIFENGIQCIDMIRLSQDF
ncbi:GNAT family N-acetyltransferase [Cytobacillus spongiae]|uniref:GNAT family N-acetyltransferase n=1 Tax=Cytobacillus spongiae TaxID=2901381 RepID=UPI001F1FF48C|nr:GNAT family N-acetyltransferase [Cytobacillus spongiae]UII54209.1 GNAT family N-acetyltransferase [Cytobacillus spongiae]